MADIAFLLLIFFLVATTMNVDSGIQRLLPQMPPDETEEQKIDVKKRNIMLVFVNKYDQINANGEIIDLSLLKDKVKAFVKDPQGPEVKVENIEKLGNYPISQGIVSLQNDRGTSYNMYIRVQNELTRAFNEMRDELSMAKFKRKFADLDEEHRKIIQKAIPQKISEAEPRNIEGGK